MYSEINDCFAAISRKLTQLSCNYLAEFQLFVSEEAIAEDIDTAVKMILGEHAVVGEATVVTKKDVIEELKNALRYRGDDGSHPSLEYLDSPASRRDFEHVISAVEALLDKSVEINSLSLKDGHPFYPVFWDFAFLIQTCDAPILFIASSSD